MEKVNVTVGEMMRLREQGLSNADIAAVLDISRSTVFRYIGKQGGRMESLATTKQAPKRNDVILYKEPFEEKPEEKPAEKPAERHVDRLRVLSVTEMLASTSGSFESIIEYDKRSVTALGTEVSFDDLPELVTFLIGVADRIERKGNEVESQH